MTPQSVTVTGTLVDSAGNSWTGATIIAQFIPGFGTPITEYTWAGAQFTKRQEFIASGNSFSVSLPSNDTILPIDSQWQFVISGNPWTPAVVLFKVLDYSKAATVDISAEFLASAGALQPEPGGGGGVAPQIIQVADEATALSSSAANPNNFYFWV